MYVAYSSWTVVLVLEGCHEWYPAKMDGLIEVPFGMWGGVGPSNGVFDRGPDPFRRRGNFGVGKGPYHSKYREHEPSVAERGLARSRWRLACGLGCQSPDLNV